MFKTDTGINLEKIAMSKFSLTFSFTKLLASLICRSDTHVAYLQEQLSGQRPSEVATHTEESPPVSPCAF